MSSATRSRSRQALSGARAPRGRRAPSAWSSAVAVAVGIPATAVGVGIGIPHAAAGLTRTAVAGLLSLLIGTASLGLVIGRSWRGARWRGRTGLVVVCLLTVQFVLMPVSLALFATHRAPMPLPELSPADVGLPYREVTFRTADGVHLAAWYVPSRNGAAVVVRHGSGSTRADVLEHTAVLASHGYGVLATDARGHGGSGGRAMDLGWYGDRDIAAAVAFLERTPDVVAGRIGTVGLSMGGEEAIGAAAAVPGLRAVVAEGVTGRTGDDRLPLRPAGPGRWASALYWTVEDAAARVLSGAVPPPTLRNAVRDAGVPVLVIAAGERTEEGVAARLLEAAAPDRVQVWEVPGADHIGGLATAPDVWARRVLGHLDRTLLPTEPEGAA